MPKKIRRRAHALRESAAKNDIIAAQLLEQIKSHLFLFLKKLYWNDNLRNEVTHFAIYLQTRGPSLSEEMERAYASLLTSHTVPHLRPPNPKSQFLIRMSSQTNQSTSPSQYHIFTSSPPRIRPKSKTISTCILHPFPLIQVPIPSFKLLPLLFNTLYVTVAVNPI